MTYIVEIVYPYNNNEEIDTFDNLRHAIDCATTNDKELYEREFNNPDVILSSMDVEMAMDSTPYVIIRDQWGDEGEYDLVDYPVETNLRGYLESLIP